MSKTLEVIGVGDAGLDLFLEVDHVPGPDEKVRARKSVSIPGGMVANFLVDLSRLGTSCGFHGLLGQDEPGRIVLDDLKANGVDVSEAIVRSGRTYSCVVMICPSGEKSLVIVPSECMFINPEDVSVDSLRRARHVHTTSGNFTTAVTVAKIARSEGVTISLDLEADSIDPGKDIKGLLGMVDVLFLNRRALESVCGTTSERFPVQSLSKLGPSVVCVTLGQNGAIVVERGKAIQIRALPVEVTDSTGAGDGFCAGFIHGILQGWASIDCLRLASAVASSCVTHVGGHVGAPTIAEARDLLAKYGMTLPA
jgi:sugar/nucleoside kinase (ribokinase family)